MIPSDLKAGLEQTPKSHVKTVASVQHSACFLTMGYEIWLP